MNTFSIILDVAVTAIDGQTHICDDNPRQPLQARYRQKITKYGEVAAVNRYEFIPAVFSYAMQGKCLNTLELSC